MGKLDAALNQMSITVTVYWAVVEALVPLAESLLTDVHAHFPRLV